MRTEGRSNQSHPYSGIAEPAEELKKTNDSLGQQAESLQQSETLLKKQQEELQRHKQQLQENGQAAIRTDEICRVQEQGSSSWLSGAREKAEHCR